jgi:hypothetical protein
MYAIQQPANLRSNEMTGAARPVSPRAALGIWAVASFGGWVIVAGLLRAVGIL